MIISNCYIIINFIYCILADESRQLTLMYLANDVIQNSKKKGPEYGKQFGTVLKKAFEIMGGDACSEKTQKSLHRLLNIWEERGVYTKETIDEFKSALGNVVLSFLNYPI